MTDEEIWAQFLEFIGRAPEANHPGVLFVGFRQDLIDRGFDSEEAAEMTRTVARMSLHRQDFQVSMFDRIYADPEPGFSTLPNELLVEAVADRPPGTALDIAMGQGRNAVYLASIGWQVTGFDVSSEGVAATNRAASAKGVEVDAQVASAEDFDYGTEAWDLIVMTYAMVPVTNPTYAQKLIGSLRPGGALVVESFATDPSGRARPVDIDPEALKKAYGSMHVIRFNTGQRVAEWTEEPVPVVRGVFSRA